VLVVGRHTFSSKENEVVRLVGFGADIFIMTVEYKSFKWFVKTERNAIGVTDDFMKNLRPKF
jgi:hypothetical protein